MQKKNAVAKATATMVLANAKMVSPVSIAPSLRIKVALAPSIACAVA